MPRLLDALVETSFAVADACGLRWRVRRVTSELVSGAGGSVAMLLSATSSDTLAEVVKGRRSGDLSDDEALAYLLARVDPAKLATRQEAVDRQRDAVVAAGVVAVGRVLDGVEEWEDLQVTLDERRVDKDKGVLHLTQIPASAVPVLHAAIMDLSTEGGAAGARLAAFLGGHDVEPAPVPPPREGVREVAARGPRAEPVRAGVRRGVPVRGGR